MNKEEIFKQIDEFNSQLTNPDDKSSKTYLEAYLYVSKDIAEDRAKFFGEVIKRKDFENIIDLTFGSGNLTSHIVLDNDLKYKTIIFNDKNEDKVNNSLLIENKEYQYLDVIQSVPNDQFDLVVFNPQIGGNYTKGRFDIENYNPDDIVVSDKKIEDYLHLDSSYKVSIDPIEREILIANDTKTKKEMKQKIGNLKIFNYYDVFYQSKSSKKEGQKTKIVKFRKNLDSILKYDTIIAFYGDLKTYDVLFKDFNYIRYMADDGQDLFLLSKEFKENKCYEKQGDKFIINPECKKSLQVEKKEYNLKALSQKLKEEFLSFSSIGGVWGDEDNKDSIIKQNEKQTNDSNDDKTYEINLDKSLKENLNFPYKNILFKGVPGTGKSRMIDRIVEEKLGLKKDSDKYKNNVLKINIHSASSNADLMQGIAITTKDKQIFYKEKTGLVLNHIQKALFNPYEPFVLVLEEIQENSLNELIGDLIYLIEPEKRAKINTVEDFDKRKYFLDELIAFYKEKLNCYSVKTPNLVSDGDFREMIMPNNFYVFCTSNYRDDKKVIEDNLLRRFDVIELYPNPNVIESEKIRKFFDEMNKAILETFKDEIHPDRYLIGHANWIEIKDFNDPDFYKALLKVVIEFKDIKEVDFELVKEIFEKLKNNYSNLDIYDEDNLENYKTLIDFLQSKVYKDFF